MANLNDISSNSDEARRNEQEMTEIIEPEFTPIEKVSVIGRFLGIFGIDTDLGGAAGSVWEDVIKPTFLDGCRDSMYALADYFFGGGGGNRNRSRGGNDKTAYSKKYKGGGQAKKGKSPNQAYYYIPNPDRTYVLDKLNDMWDVVNQCDFCTVQDMLTIFGVKTNNYTLDDWGWTAKDLGNVRAVRNQDGDFYLNLPKPRPKDE